MGLPTGEQTGAEDSLQDREAYTWAVGNVVGRDMTGDASLYMPL